MKSLFYLNKYFYKYRIRLISGFIFVILSGWFKVYSTPFIRKGIDYANDTVLKYPKSIPYTGHLLYYVAVILGMAIISGLFLFLTRQTLIVTSRLIEFDLKNEIFEHYQKLDMAFYKRNNTGDLMNRISEDVSRSRMYAGPALMYAINNITLIIITLIVMLKVNGRLTFFVLIPLPLLYISVYYISFLINKKSTVVQQQLSTIFSKAQESFSGIRVIKSYRLENRFSAIFKKECDDYRKKNMSLVKVDSLFQPFLALLVGISTVIVIYVGGKDAMLGKITPGNIVEFIIYVQNLTMPFAALGWVTTLIQRAAASQTRINEFLNTMPEITSASDGADLAEGEIQFSDVSFVYPDSGIIALKNVSFTIHKHESVGIVGKTGSGKSTIAQLLCRLFEVSSGSISIAGKDIRQIPLKFLRRHIGYVPQEVFLFSDTISNNIDFSETYITNSGELHKSRIEQAAKDAAVYDNIEGFRNGFETVIGERGITLSGGQKQRISIARAMFKAPGILIFDECLSAVDTNTEQEILLNIRRMMQGRTTLIITHRISSVKMCDKIIVLDNGTVSQYGTHEELIAQSGIYKTMYEMQLSEEIHLHSIT